MSRTGPPPDRGVTVVRAGIGNHFTRIVVRPETRRLRISAERKLQDAHAGKPESFAEASTSGVITPRFSATIGNSPSAAFQPLKQIAPGPFTHLPFTAVVAPRRDLLIRLKTAEMIQPDQIYHVQRAPEALNPPAVTFLCERSQP